MSSNGSRSIRQVAPHSGIRHLELAPEGWRTCVERIAEGYAEVVGEHVYCLNCDGVLLGAQGHDIHCVTMIARRMLANENLLHVSFHTGMPDTGLASGSAQSSATGLCQTYRPYNRPRMRIRSKEAEYAIPTFLASARRVRSS